jgi:hypothetical protein
MIVNPQSLERSRAAVVPGEPSENGTSSRRLPKWLIAVIAALTTLGVLGAVGAYYVPGILDRLGAEVTNRVPLDFDLVLDRTETANYVFPDSLKPTTVAGALYGEVVVADEYQWVREHGGVLAEEQVVRLILWGKSESVVHIDDIRVHVIKRNEPRSGWYNANEGCGGVTEPRRVHVDLDHSPPTEVWYVNDKKVRRPAFAITASEEEVFDFTLTTSRHEFEWVFEVLYSSAARSGVLQIDNRGRPFVTTSVAKAKAYFVNDFEADNASEVFVRAPASDGWKLPKDVHPVC